MLRYTVIFSITIFLSLTSVHVFSEPVIQGFWVLNEAESDSVKKKIAVLKSKRKAGFGQSGGREGRKGGSGKSRGSSDDSGRTRRQKFGTIQQTLSAETLQIEGYEKVTITFDEEITRALIPNPYGRVFSASGDELVEDEFGRTLSYWDANSLIVETMMSRGGTVVERYRFNSESSRLVISVSIKTRRGDNLEISRVYERRKS